MMIAKNQRPRESGRCYRNQYFKQRDVGCRFNRQPRILLEDIFQCELDLPLG